MTKSEFLTNGQIDKMMDEISEKLKNEALDKMKLDIYVRLGRFLELSQHLEYYLGKFSPKKSKNAALGKILARVCNVESLDWQTQYINEIITKRNYYVHQFFKNKVEINKPPTINNYERELFDLQQTIEIMAVCVEELKKT